MKIVKMKMKIEKIRGTHHISAQHVTKHGKPPFLVEMADSDIICRQV